MSVELTLDGAPVDRGPVCLWSLPLGGHELIARAVAAARAAERGNTNAWKAGVEAFLNELSAQTGKRVSSEASQILVRDAVHLLAEGPGF